MEKDRLKQKIEFLIEAYYNNFDFLRYDSLENFKKEEIDKYLDSGLSFEEIQERIENDVLEDEKISKNHQDLYDTLEELAYLLRLADVNYYIEGGLVGYLKYNEESNRVHNNINITVEEKDYDKFKSICNTFGLEVVERSNTKTEVLDENDINICLSSFKTLNDGSIVSKKYDENGNLKEEFFNSKLAKIVYGNESADFREYKLNVILPEYVYYLKKDSSSEKDNIDIEFLKDKIDKSKLDLVEELSKIEIQDKDEISNMMEDSQTEMTEEVEKEKPKVFEKKDTSNEGGYAESASISGMNIFALILTIICLIIMYFVIK